MFFWTAIVALLASLLVPAVEVDAPPAEFTNRVLLPSCGEVDAGLEKASGPAVDCFERALSEGTGAELVVGRFTDEGDPVVYFHRSLPGEPGMEVFEDARQDSFGSRTWRHGTCPEATGVDDMGSCRWA